MASIVLALVVILAFSPVPLEASLHADGGVDYAASTLSSGFPVTIVDDTGYRLVIKKAPARIVSLAPSNTEILFSLGLGDRLVGGVTTACDYPQAAAKIDKSAITPST